MHHGSKRLSLPEAVECVFNSHLQNHQKFFRRCGTYRLALARNKASSALFYPRCGTFLDIACCCREALGREQRRRLQASAETTHNEHCKVLVSLAGSLELQDALLKSFASQMKDACTTSRTMVCSAGPFDADHPILPGPCPALHFLRLSSL